jgi:hypothetical protein
MCLHDVGRRRLDVAIFILDPARSPYKQSQIPVQMIDIYTQAKFSSRSAAAMADDMLTLPDPPSILFLDHVHNMIHSSTVSVQPLRLRPRDGRPEYDIGIRRSMDQD